MLNPLEEKILSYLIEHKNEGDFIGLKFADEKFIDVCDSVKSLAKKGYVNEACTLISAAARITPKGQYYFEDMVKHSKTEKSYYQVLIVTNNNEKISETDLKDINDILDRILIPYLLNNEFYINGYVLSKEKISRIKIGVTALSAKQLAAYENEQIPENIIYSISDSDIIDFNEYTTDVTSALVAKAKKIIADKNRNNGEIKKLDKTKVFLVHGRDNELKQEVARFVTQLKIKPIILHEQPSSGKTIIEKIEAYSNVGFGIVLYTPCDVGYEKNDEENKQGRARQNVVFEHGYLIGKLGRDRVCALIKQEVEKPNDISGVVYVTYDINGGWKLQIAKEMHEAGYDIDLNSLLL